MYARLCVTSNCMYMHAYKIQVITLTLCLLLIVSNDVLKWYMVMKANIWL